MTVRHVLILTLILLLALVPTGLAEGVYGQLTLNNFQVTLADNEPVDVDAVLKMGGGYSEEDGLFRVDADMTGGGKTAFTASMDAADEALRVKLGGANIYLTLPYEALDAYTEASGQYEGAFKNRKAFVAFLAKNMSTPSAASTDPFAKPITAARKALKAQKSAEEQVELFWEIMMLRRFDESLDGEEIGSFLEALAEADASLKSGIEALVWDIWNASGVKATKPDNIADSIASVIEKADLDVRADITCWVDAQALDDDAIQYMKATAKLTVTQPAASKGAKATTTELSIDLSSMDTVDGEYSTLTINSRLDPIYGLSMSYQGNYNVPRGYGTTNFSTMMVNDVVMGVSTPVAMCSFENVIDSAYLNHAIFTGKAVITGQPLEVNFRYDGKTATADRYEGAVAIDFAVEEFTGSLKFDALLETSPLVPLTDEDYASLTAVNPLDPDDENAQLIMPEMAAVGAKASGVLMTTPGIPHLISTLEPTD